MANQHLGQGSGTAEDKIVAATEQLLGSRPIEELTLDDVATASGVDRGIVERYFPSVDRIAARLLRDLVGLIDEGAGWLTAPPDADFDQLIAIQAHNVASIYARHGAIIAALSEATPKTPEVRNLWATVIERRVQLVADRLRGLADLGVLRPIDEPDLVASALVLMAHHTLVRLYRHRSDVPVDQAARAIHTLWFHGVFPDEADADAA